MSLVQGAKCYKGSMKRFFPTFVLALALFSLSFFATVTAKEMAADSEQFYVVQGLFAELGIETVACELEDPDINFACGQFTGDLPTFQAQIDGYVNDELPGLFLALAWFSSGETTVQDYRSAGGRYLIAYNPGGFVVVAFTPR